VLCCTVLYCVVWYCVVSCFCLLQHPANSDIASTCRSRSALACRPAGRHVLMLDQQQLLNPRDVATAYRNDVEINEAFLTTLPCNEAACEQRKRHRPYSDTDSSST
jgi:hypothetical protein